IFRYENYLDGYRVFSLDKECFLKNDGNKVVIYSDDIDYFYSYFNLDYDYEKVYNFAQNYDNEFVKLSSKLGKGIRILKQNALEMVISFMISQNNNIPKITKSLNYLSQNYGQKRNSARGEYFTFCDVKNLSKLTEDDFKKAGVGYRASYLVNLIKEIENGLDFNSYNSLSTVELYQKLIKIKGIGDKVANCILLFGYNRYDSFPVDVWTYKIYKEDFKGTLENRAKITEYFINEFKEYSGIIQQYLFYYKRSLQNK
ncbi:MAG: hypothetical protein IJW26_06280, partial [Clostridia bacterium]|nr:hypothetical protein [Clostridia bacterium]